MKTEYQFNPAGHWNYIPESVYNVLKEFYSDDMLRIVVTE